MPGQGLRERKKQRTREAIAAAALDLFEQKGFAATTIREIAERADVAPRTVSLYFPVKEQLVFDGYEELFTEIRRRLADRPPGTSTAATLREMLRENLEDPARDVVHERRVHAVVEATPALRTFERGIMEQAEQLVAEAVAVDLGVAADSLLPHMVGAATVAALDALGKQIGHGAGDPAEALALVDDAMRFIGGGVRALQGDDA